MSKYVDCDALCDAVLELPPKMDEDGYGWLGRRGVWQMICDFPAADVRPVVRAFWIDIWSESDPNTSPSAKCSNCGKNSERPVGSFCKWCGADMREES